MFFGLPRGAVKRGKQIFPNIYAFDELPNLDCNTFVFKSQDNRVAVVDPGNGLNFDPLLEGLKAFDITFDDIKWVIVTHVHVDHLLSIYSMQEFVERTQGSMPEIIALGESARVIRDADVDAIFPGEIGMELSPSIFGVEVKPLPVTEVKEGDQLNLGDFSFQVMECPGHAEGMMCLLELQHKILISGDVIFTGGSFGRVDFPGGSAPKLLDSIERLANLDFDVLFPGHTSVTTSGKNAAQMSLKIARQFF
ncbi:MAG TPA: MBL fold metallo-hydrolase [Candidatus Lokiarchaeia archaeon]|nr:MBL fold metallo-hydrolase [Candidatus Lokiarchaeia archaeon]